MNTPTDADRAFAEQIAAWMAALPEDAASDYLYNLGMYGRLAMVPVRGTGIVASAWLAFQREQVKAAESAKARTESQHVGKVGDKVTFKGLLTHKASGEGQWGWWYLYVFKDESGNVLTTFRSEPLSTAEQEYFETGQTYILQGKVKEHEVRNEVKQTKLTHVKLVVEKPVKEKKSRKLPSVNISVVTVAGVKHQGYVCDREYQLVQEGDTWSLRCLPVGRKKFGDIIAAFDHQPSQEEVEKEVRK